jgi:hypothetical protein
MITIAYIQTEVSLPELARQYQITYARMRQIIRQTDPAAVAKKRQHRHARLARRIEAAVDDGALSRHDVAERLGLSYGLVEQLFKRPDLSTAPEKMRSNRKAARRRTEKRCSVCKIVKPLAEYHRGGSSIDRTAARCKPCANKAAMAWSRASNVLRPTVEEKRCPACQCTLPASEFSRSRHSKSGLQTYCYDCQKRLSKGETVPDIAASYGLEYRRTRQKFGENDG